MSKLYCFIFCFLCIGVTSCIKSEVIQTSPDTEIQRLKEEISNLKLENANLKEEINLRKAGGEPNTIRNTDGQLSPDETTYEEGNYESCMKQANDNYLSVGTKLCKEAKYSDQDIQSNKCKLDQKDMDTLISQKKQAESTCQSLYK